VSSRARGAGAAALTAVALFGASALGAAAPAQAATSTGWRQVYSHHYGATSDFSGYEAVVALGAKNAWAFGGTDRSRTGTPAIVHWNGKAWGTVALPSGLTSRFNAASAPAANDIWAVTFEGGWILHYDGHQWRVAKHVTGGGEFTGVTALSAGNVWVFGGPGPDGGLGTWHFDGKTWKKWTTGQAAGLSGGQALSPDDIWAIGGTQAPASVIERFNGKAWYKANAKGIPAGQWFFSTPRVVTDKDVWVPATEIVNNSEVPFLLHYNGSSWTKLALPWPVGSGQNSEIGSITADGHGGLWFTGITSSGGQDNVVTYWVLRRTAVGQWLRTKISTQSVPPATDLVRITQVPGTGTIWGVGFNQAKSAGGSAVIWAYGKL
jgi:hypothetical protein